MYKVASLQNETMVEKSLWSVLEEFGKRLSRIEEALQYGAQVKNEEDRFSFGEGMVNRRRFTYTGKRGESVRLFPRELKLLEIFAEHPYDVLDRDMLLSRIWGIDYYGNTRTLDQHIGHLRRKLGSDGEYIVTINRVGYSYQPRNRKVN